MNFKPLALLIALTLSATLSFAGTNNDALYHAVRKSDTTAMRRLLDAKADPNYVLTVGPAMKLNLLTTAVNNGSTAVVKMLLEYKADVHWRDGFNTSPVMYAAGLGHLEIVKALLAFGANVTDTDGKISVLSAAKESGNEAIILLVEERLKEVKK